MGSHMSDRENLLSELSDGSFPNAPLLREADGRVVARFRGNRIRSVFQPVMSNYDGSTVGHFARVRSDRDGIAPVGGFHWAALAVTGPPALVLQLDRMSRTLHALNYFSGADPAWRLFLRVQSRLIETVGSGHGRVFERILATLGVPTRAIVIELPRDLNEDPALFSRALLSYRSLGYKVAADCLHDADAMLRGRYDVVPDVVVLDHRWVSGRAALEDLVGQIHAVGAQALVTRIENAETFRTAREIGADLLQGYHLGRPERLAAPAAEPGAGRGLPGLRHMTVVAQH
jgi:EAL domain-containing protein (putative c-di-GMP-specific phosphodiesterase class I)